MIKSLSSIRFLFAILVFLVHANVFKVAIGHAFFIVLSGFILSMVYEERLLTKKMTSKTFYRKRFERIYPLHILTLIISIPISLYWFHQGISQWLPKIILNALFLQIFIPDINYYFSFNGVSWNAADLMIFYLLFPLLIVFFNRISTKGFTFFIIATIMLIISLMGLLPHHLYHFFFYISPFRIFDFIFGMYLYRIIKNRQFNINKFSATLLEVFTILLFIIWFGIVNIYSDSLKPYLYSVLLWIPLAIVILVFYFEKGYISGKILSSPLFYKLGGISFSFYMVHQLVIRYYQRINKNYFDLQEGFTFYFLCFLTSVILAYLSNRYFEKLFYKSNSKIQ